jgi:hypothetical protein
LDGIGYRRCPIHQLFDERLTNLGRSPPPASVNCLLRLSAGRQRGDLDMAVNAFWLRVEPYVDCDWRANVQRSQAPRKIFERGALWQCKEQRAICEKRSDAAWVWLFMDASHGVPPVLRRQRFVG